MKIVKFFSPHTCCREFRRTRSVPTLPTTMSAKARKKLESVRCERNNLPATGIDEGTHREDGEPTNT